MLIVPGTFNDVLHVRETVTLSGKSTNVDDYWWARSLGMIQRQGIFGKDASIGLVLTNSSLLAVPNVSVTVPPAPKTTVRIFSPI